jgi:hypothetical protein
MGPVHTVFVCDVHIERGLCCVEMEYLWTVLHKLVDRFWIILNNDPSHV